jgi:hypothetical protein
MADQLEALPREAVAGVDCELLSRFVVMTVGGLRGLLAEVEEETNA